MRLSAPTVALVLVSVIALAVPASAGAASVEQQLEEAKQRRIAVEERLATEAGDLEGLEHQVHAAEQELAAIDERAQQLRSELDDIHESLAVRSRHVFMHGDQSALQLIIGANDFGDVADGAALFESLALRDRASVEAATAVRTRLATTRAEGEARRDELAALEADLQERIESLLADLEQIQRDEERFGEELRRQREEERRQREAREARAAAAAAAESSSRSSAPAPVTSGNLACPVGDPVAFSDTWGAPRSGGRSHQGVDMMAPHGTPVYAITDGKITRLHNSGLGGISLYMYGDDGNEYFYTHLQGYASGIRSGQRVSAGTLVAYNGSTGNASSSAPHVHFEVHPGGGRAVNPYPYAARACGR